MVSIGRQIKLDIGQIQNFRTSLYLSHGSTLAVGGLLLLRDSSVGSISAAYSIPVFFSKKRGLFLRG